MVLIVFVFPVLDISLSWHSARTQRHAPSSCEELVKIFSTKLNETYRTLYTLQEMWYKTPVSCPVVALRRWVFHMYVWFFFWFFLLSLVQIVIYLNSTRKQELLNSILKTIFPKSALNSWYVREPLRNLLSLQRTIDSLFLEVTKTMETLERLRNWSRAYHELFLTLYLPKIESKSPKWKWPFPSAPRLPLYVLKHLWFCFRTEVFSCQVFLTSGT